MRISDWSSDVCSSDLLFLTVEDDGPGLTPEQAAIVAPRGARLDETTPGWGLGLGIVADLAAINGGSFAIDRSELGGVRATLTLPGGRGQRSEERRGGKACGRTCRSRLSPYHLQKQ